MTTRVSLETVTRAERQSTIDAIGSAIQEVGGWIDDIHFFSNISVALHFFIPASRSLAFGRMLVGIGLKLDYAAMTSLEQLSSKMPANEEIPVSLQIAFFHDEPDFRRQIPSVPG